jgi:hypothetical protein
VTATIRMNEQLKAQRNRLVRGNTRNTPFFEMLRRHPSLALQSAEDTKCRALFSALGILDDFGRDVTPTTSILAVDGHPTHWIFGCCHSGNSDPNNNGYSVACLPRTSCSRQQFYEFVDEMVEKIGGNPNVKRLTSCRKDWHTKN